MSKPNAEEKKLKIRKLSLNRETLRTLSAEKLEKVAGGFRTTACGVHYPEVVITV